MYFIILWTKRKKINIKKKKKLDFLDFQLVDMDGEGGISKASSNYGLVFAFPFIQLALGMA